MDFLDGDKGSPTDQNAGRHGPGQLAGQKGFFSAQNHIDNVIGSVNIYLCQKPLVNEIETVFFASGDLGVARRRGIEGT